MSYASVPSYACIFFHFCCRAHCHRGTHIACAVRDGCKEFQNSRRGEDCCLVVQKCTDLSQDLAAYITGTDGYGLICLMMDAASCSLCTVCNGLSRYATSELNASSARNTSVSISERMVPPVSVYRHERD